MSDASTPGFGRGRGLDKARLSALYGAIQRTYLADARPWVIGYSGGKDSTATLQLVWRAVSKIPAEKRTKPIHVIASDTLVESPIIVGHLRATLEQMNEAAKAQGMPITAQLVYPEPDQTFWVNMVGRGYPAPYKRFRWCTERLKINPANKFIREQVAKHGEVVLALGVRRAESASRAQTMAQHKRFDEYLSRHSTITNAWVFTPVEDWSLDDVWDYLLTTSNPWGGHNRELVTLYKNAQAGECPLVVDTSTPSCGNSRFGCWVCTVVEKDKSMEAMIDNGEEWMAPLLELRNWLVETQDPARKHLYRDPRRRSGKVQMWGDNLDKVIWGPYKFEVRQEILRRLLTIQRILQDDEGQDVELISAGELHEIRRLWRTELGDWEDTVPRIFREVFGRDLAWQHNDEAVFDDESGKLLEAACKEHGVPAALVRELITIELDVSGLARRSNVFKRIEGALAKDWRSEDEIFEALNMQFGLGEDEEAGHAV